MDYIVSLTVFLFISGAVTPLPSNKLSVLSTKEYSNGPLALSQADKITQELDFLKATYLGDSVNLLTDPGEGTHDILHGILKGADSAIGRLEHLVEEIKNHEEQSHQAIDKIRFYAPEETDICVQDVYGMSNRAHPVYCSVKYFSRVAIALYEIRGTIEPLRKSVTKLTTDLTACNKINGSTDAFICRAQALRDAWEDSDVVRARLNRHLNDVRQLVIDINECLKSNQPTQMQLVDQVHQCTRAKTTSSPH